MDPLWGDEGRHRKQREFRSFRDGVRYSHMTHTPSFAWDPSFRYKSRYISSSHRGVQEGILPPASTAQRTLHRDHSTWNNQWQLSNIIPFGCQSNDLFNAPPPFRCLRIFTEFRLMMSILYLVSWFLPRISKSSARYDSSFLWSQTMCFFTWIWRLSFFW